MYFSLTLYTTMCAACLWSGLRMLTKLNRIHKEGGRVEAKITGIVKGRSRDFYNLRYVVGGTSHNAFYPVPYMGKGFQIGQTVTYCYIPGKEGEQYVEEDTTYHKGGWLMVGMGAVLGIFAVWNLLQIL